MTDRLNVQRDDVGRVVRLLSMADSDDTLSELDPDHAVALGEELIRAGRELQTTQSQLSPEPSDGQSTLAESSEDNRKPLAAVLEADRPTPEIGGVLNPDDPLDW